MIFASFDDLISLPEKPHSAQDILNGINCIGSARHFCQLLKAPDTLFYESVIELCCNLPESTITALTPLVEQDHYMTAKQAEYWLTVAVRTNNQPLLTAAIAGCNRRSADINTLRLIDIMSYDIIKASWPIRATYLAFLIRWYATDTYKRDNFDSNNLFEEKLTSSLLELLLCAPEEYIENIIKVIIDGKSSLLRNLLLARLDLSVSRADDSDLRKRGVEAFKKLAAKLPAGHSTPRLKSAEIIFGKADLAITQLSEDYAAYYPRIVDAYLASRSRTYYDLLSLPELQDWQRNTILAMLKDK